MEVDEMREWCRALPKIELHAHLNGSIRDSTLLELVRVLGEKGVIDFADVEPVILKSSRTLPECFELFYLHQIPATDHAIVSRITKEVIEDFAAENAVYLELRTTPKVPNPEEVQAILEFHPKRIGHACCLEEAEWTKLKRSKIPVEICLTSNIRTNCVSSIDDHHFVDLYNGKHPIALCTDDPGLFSTSLSHEYFLAASTFGLSKTELYQLAKNATDLVFADDGVKKEVFKIFEAAEKELLP